MLLLLNQHVLYVSQGIDVVVARVLLSVGAAGAGLWHPAQEEAFERWSDVLLTSSFTYELCRWPVWGRSLYWFVVTAGMW